MDNSNLQTEVVINGAGPTGLSLAAQLMRYNISFIILEKKEQTTPLSKAVVVQARTLEIFNDIGLAGKAIGEGRMTTALNAFYKGKQKVNVDLAGLGNGLSAFPFALSLEQSKTEKLLVDYIEEHGGKINWKCELLHLDQETDSVTVYYKDGDGKEQVINANYLVGCDGAGSLVRHQLGLSFEGDTVPKIFYVTDVILSSPVINKDELFIFLIPKGFVLFFPMEGEGHYRVIGIIPGETDDKNITFEAMESFVKEQIVTPVDFKTVKWFSTYKVHSRKANSFMKGRCFIAGDAGHIHTPAGGQGMNTGIQDAYNLAWKIAYTIKFNANETVLNSYNTERTANAKRLLETTDRMFDFMTGSNSFLNFIRLNIFPAIARFISKNSMFNKRIYPLLSQTNIAYPDSALTVPGRIKKVNSGDRMPYFMADDGKSIYEYIGAPAFKLLFFGTEALPDFERLQMNFLNIVCLTFKEIPKHIFGSASDFYILLRPDNHISYIGKSIDDCNAFLHTLITLGKRKLSVVTGE